MPSHKTGNRVLFRGIKQSVRNDFVELLSEQATDKLPQF